MLMRWPVRAFLCMAAAFCLGAADDDWERLDDGSTGKVVEFTGSGGVTIPAYIRKPAGDGPFPVIVMLHGGR